MRPAPIPMPRSLPAIRQHAVLVMVLALVAALLSGCSVFSDDEAEAEAAAAAAAAEAAAEAAAGPDRPVPVDGVTGIEIGRLTDGIVITAFGVAPTAGYATPELSPRRAGAPGPDGFVEFDLLAVPPNPGLEMPQGNLRVREVRADRLLRIDSLQGIAGIRIHALRNFRELRF